MSGFFTKLASNLSLYESAMLVNGPPFFFFLFLLGRQSNLCKGLLEIAWVQRAAKIPTLKFLAVMAAIMDWFVYVRKASGFRKFSPECYSLIYLFIFLPVIWIPSISKGTHKHTVTHSFRPHHTAPPIHRPCSKAVPVWPHSPVPLTASEQWPWFQVAVLC